MGSFSGSNPPWLVLSHDITRINTTNKLALFWRFSLTAGSISSHSLATGHYPLAPGPTPHDRRGPPSMPRAELGRAPLPARGSTCYDMLRFPVSAEVWRASFSDQVYMQFELTSISLLRLVGRDFRLNCILKQELRRYDPRSKSLKK